MVLEKQLRTLYQESRRETLGLILAFEISKSSHVLTPDLITVGCEPSCG